MKGPRSQTVTQSNEPPLYVQDAQRQLADAAQRITGPYLVNAPPNITANFTPDQFRAFDLARMMANREFASPAPSVPSGNAGKVWTSKLTSVAPNIGQVTGSQITPFLNPFRDDVLNPTIDLMRRELDRTQAGIGARNASAAAFGGSREALQLAETDRAFGDQVAKITGDLMLQGYDRATATALANAQSRQAVGQFNAAQENAMRQFNDTQRNQRLESDANRRLAAAGLQNTFQNDESQRQLRALAALLGTGGQQQQVAQEYLREPVEMLKLLMQATPGGVGGTSSTTQPTQSSPLSTIAGLASIGGGLFGPLGIFPGALAALSDERDKTDIKKLGRDPETGLNMYAYRYKSDPKNTPKVVGPMAQEVERKYPGAVREIGGHKVIDGGFLRAALGVGA